jgi:hypothetical protein
MTNKESTMTDNERKVDDILKKYLPDPSGHELKAIHDRVLHRLANAIEAKGLDRAAFVEAATRRTTKPLSQFEQAVLGAALQLHEHADIAGIAEQVSRSLSKPADVTDVYSSLNRLEEQGYVTSWYSEANAEKNKKPRRYFKVTAVGEFALAEARAEAREEGIDPLGDFA